MFNHLKWNLSQKGYKCHVLHPDIIPKVWVWFEPIFYSNYLHKIECELRLVSKFLWIWNSTCSSKCSKIFWMCRRRVVPLWDWGGPLHCVCVYMCVWLNSHRGRMLRNRQFRTIQTFFFFTFYFENNRERKHEMRSHETEQLI